MTTQYHHVKEKWITFPVDRRTSTGEKIPPPGLYLATCDCGWEQGVSHSGHDAGDRSMEFNRLVQEHDAFPDEVPEFVEKIAETANTYRMSNSGHPLFRPGKYTRKTNVEAMHLGSPLAAVGIKAWVEKSGGTCEVSLDSEGFPKLNVFSSTGKFTAMRGDWVIKEDKTLRVCSNWVFENEYERVAEEPRRWKYPVC